MRSQAIIPLRAQVAATPSFLQVGGEGARGGGETCVEGCDDFSVIEDDLERGWGEDGEGREGCEVGGGGCGEVCDEF